MIFDQHSAVLARKAAVVSFFTLPRKEESWEDFWWPLPFYRWISDINDSLRGYTYRVKHDRSLHGNSRIYILNPIQTLLLLFNTSIEEDMIKLTQPLNLCNITTPKLCVLFMWQTEGTEQKYLINLKRRQMSSETFVCLFERLNFQRCV